MKKTGRLTHSPRGFLRHIQMSKHRLWIFVEGLLDRSFYSHICTSNQGLKEVSYTIALAREVPEFSGNGKQALLDIYCYLRERRALINKLEQKSTGVLFMLDKDIDDLEGTRRRSAHVVYTECYCIENYLFRFGDLSSALSAAAGLDLRSVTMQIGLDSLAWTRRAAQNWRPWVEYCLLVKQLRIRNTRGYGLASSQMHVTAYSPCSASKQTRLLEDARKNSGLTSAKFGAQRERVANAMKRLYSRAKHDVVFNGKWYGNFLAEDAKRAAGSRQYYRLRLEQKLRPCLLGTLDFSASWADRFHSAIDCMTALLVQTNSGPDRG